MKIWPIRNMRVVCSGLQAKQVVLVGERAYVYRIYHRGSKGSRWLVERTPVASVDDHRSAGDDVEVARTKTRTAAEESIVEDAKKLERFENPQPQLPEVQ